MEKASPVPIQRRQGAVKRVGRWLSISGFCLAALLLAYRASSDLGWIKGRLFPGCHHHYHHHHGGVYGSFPRPGDPFQFMPCTTETLPPALSEPNPEKTWGARYDPDPGHWNWGNATAEEPRPNDPYWGRGIYLCGYLDVPLDYTNKSDSRIARLAITKFQASGLARVDGRSKPGAGVKSERTIIIEPGGPGGSGTSYAWRGAEQVTKRFSDGIFDVLGWDPRGVNASLPAISCFPYDADRDRWALLTGQYREVVSSPMAQLRLMDAYNEALFKACWEIHGDLPRFVSTSFVARDMEEIRLALDEDELTGYLVSYGTGIGQTYANMFPNSVGRMILDGTENVRDGRENAGFGWASLDNVTDAWHDGFLGECLNAGPNHCALAKSKDGGAVSLHALQERMESLINSLIERPMVGYSESSGPSMITYSGLVGAIYTSLYSSFSWPALAQMLFELEDGNSTLATAFLERSWEYDPTMPCAASPHPASEELTILVICADAYDAPHLSLEEYEPIWANMTSKSWISGNPRFFYGLPCRQFTKYWPEPAEVYRGDLNNTLKHPVLLIAETYDPATPLRNGRRLLHEMGDNARLIAHHGYGHSSRDTSNCTDSIAKAFILEGTLPEESETACYANEKPYLYGVKKDEVFAMQTEVWDPVQAWIENTRPLGG